MKCYIIPIGGTGERVMRAIMHLLACGAFDEVPKLEKVKVMGVDPDMTSDAKDKFVDTLKNYQELRRHTVFKHSVETPQNVVWTPMSAQHTTMNNELKDETADEGIKKLYSFLYSKKERNLDLDGGYYSHTSIGSYFMLSNVIDDDGNFIPVWRDFFSGITSDDKIIIICSMFGGTGASGVPTIAKELRRHDEVGAMTCDAEISGIFLEPYFESDQRRSTVNTSAFATKSKMALEYYQHQGFGDDVFDKMYFLGESKEMMRVVHKESGAAQKNKANVIELYAGTAVIDALISGGTAKKVMFRGTERTNDIFPKKTLNMVQGISVYDKIAEFFVFSVIYTKLLYHMIDSDDPQKTRSGFRRGTYDPFLKGYDVLGSVDGRTGIPKANVEAKLLYSYCLKYITWIREIITESEGYVEFDEQWLSNEASGNFQYTENWFTRIQFRLFDGKPTQAQDPISMCEELDFNQSELYPGLPRVVKGWELKDTAVIFNEISSIARDRRSQPGSIADLMRDVLKELE